MTRRALIGCSLLSILMILAALALSIASPDGANFPFEDAGLGMFAVVGGFLALRRVGGRLAVLICLLGLFPSIETFSNVYGSYRGAAGRQFPGHGIGTIIADLAWVPGVAMISILLVLLPDGRLPGRRWRWLPWISVTVAVLIGVLGLLSSRRFNDQPGGALNPLAVLPAWVSDAAGVGGLLILLALIVVGAVSLIVRRRQASGAVRAQLRWLLLTPLVAIAIGGLAKLSESISLPIADALSFASTATIPVGIGVAVAKYRLWDVDRIISRTVTYGLVSGLLLGCYVGLAAAASAVLPASAGSVGVAGSTLAVAALFVPVRRRVQGTVDRRFNRARYNGQRVVDGFGARVRVGLSESELQHELMAVLQRTVQPASVSLAVIGGRP